MSQHTTELILFESQKNNWKMKNWSQRRSQEMKWEESEEEWEGSDETGERAEESNLEVGRVRKAETGLMRGGRRLKMEGGANICIPLGRS